MSKQRLLPILVILIAGVLVVVLARLEILKRAAQEAKIARSYFYNYQHPDERTKKLNEELASKTISEEAYKFLTGEDILYAEDGLKGCLVSYQTVAEDFCPPHSGYVDEALSELYKISDLYFQKQVWLLAHDGYYTITKYAEKYNGLPSGSNLTPENLKLCQDRLGECEMKMWGKKLN